MMKTMKMRKNNDSNKYQHTCARAGVLLGEDDWLWLLETVRMLPRMMFSRVRRKPEV